MESYPRPRSPEFSNGSDKEKSEGDSKKEKKIGGKVAESLIKRPAETRPDSLEPKNAESMWARIAALAEKREIDKSILKPIENADADSKLNAKNPDSVDATTQPQAADKASDTSRAITKSENGTYPAELESGPESDRSEFEKDAELENLSDGEQLETVRQYLASRREPLEQELKEVPEGATPPVESAADLAFLEFVERQMAEDENLPVEAALDKAEQITTETIETTANEVASSEPEEANGSEAATLPQEAIENDGEDRLTSENDEQQNPSEPNPDGGPVAQNPETAGVENAEAEETPIIVTPTPPTPPTASGAGGGTGNVPPPYGGGGSGTTGPSGSGGSGGGGGSSGSSGSPSFYPMPGPVPGSMPPMPGYSGMPAYAYAAPASYNTAPGYSYNLATERRRAMVQGFLVGGIIGYLIGRRRGRIKTEKRLLPIQKKLEKQVESLAETIALKEQAIRKQAAETSLKMKTLEQQKRFAESLAETARNQAMNKEQALRTQENRVAEVRSATNVHRERQHYPAPRAERLGRLLVEAPAGVLLAATSAERTKRDTGINFERKVEDYTPAELNQAAEKIRVDNVTLREIRNEHRLDDKAMRRIITAYVEGRSVREALNKELFEKELRYEQDPKYRQFETDDAATKDGNSQRSGGGGPGAIGGFHGASGGGAASAAAATVIGMAAGHGGTGTSSSSAHGNDGKSHDQKPSLSPEALAKVRRQQIAEVSVAGAILIGIIAAIVALLV